MQQNVHGQLTIAYNLKICTKLQGSEEIGRFGLLSFHSFSFLCGLRIIRVSIQYFHKYLETIQTIQDQFANCIDRHKTRTK